MNDYGKCINTYFGIADKFVDFSMGNLGDKNIEDLMKMYLDFSHDDIFEDEPIVEKKIPEFNFVK
jgi:hypothetical protein